MAVAEREVETVGDGDGAVGEAAGYVDCAGTDRPMPANETGTVLTCSNDDCGR